MSLHNYLVKSHEPYEEIRNDFLSEEVQQLCSVLKELGHTKYFAFVRAHLSDILKYIELSPSRRSQPKWKKREDILLVRFAALQISGSTVKFLADISEVAYIVNSGSYRQFHSAIAYGIAHRITEFPLLRFPFDGFDNPFL